MVHLARLKKEGHEFEIVVNPDSAIAFKEGKADIREALNSEQVYHDAKKAELASEHLMQKVFGTSDPLKVSEIIIKEGEVQVTSEHRDQKREQKKKQLIQIIHRYAVDPKTDTPHPISRIENAMEEAKVRVDEKRSAEDQIQEILKALRPIIPIKFEIKEVQITLKAAHAAKMYGTVKQFGSILSEEWMNDGSWQGIVEIPAGLEPDLYEKLNEATHGEVATKVLKVK